MRYAIALAAVAAACNVDAKHAALDAGPVDAAIDAPVTTVTIDTMIDEAPPEFSNQAQAVFRFSSNDAGATFVCRVDADPSTPCTSPFARMLADGTHVFSVRAVDTAGNADPTPAEHVWSIDTVAPDTMLLQAPPAADNSVMAEFEFTSNEMNVTFECSLDSSALLPCKSGDSFGPLGDGTHVFSVRARDRAGNIDATPALFGWTIDTSTPDTQIVSGPTGAVGVTTATFTFVSPDAGGGATFQCQLDSAAFVACTSPVTYSNLAERAHTFAVRVRDAVGNLDPTPATRTWTVDLTPPVTTITAGPTGTVPMASASFSFTANEANVTFSCSLDGGAFNGCTSPTAFTSLAQGPHTFAVRARDAAGHDDPTPATRAWTVDTVPPDVSIIAGPASGSTSGPRVAFAFTVSDGAIACSFDGAAFTACTSPAATNLAAGPHQFSIRATDAAGNAVTVTRAWTVACAAPSTTGAAGLLHLDDTGQTLANAVAGGVDATLGDTAMVEASDPDPVAAGRFGGALAFTAAQSDHVAWPLALTAMPQLTIEMWAMPSGAAGSHVLLATGDSRVMITVTAASPSTVVFAVSLTSTAMGNKTYTATSAAVSSGAWHHVLVSLADPTLRLWVDGARTQAMGVASGAAPALDSIQLGGTYGGDLDEIWLAQTAITDDETALARYCPAD